MKKSTVFGEKKMQRQRTEGSETIVLQTNRHWHKLWDLLTPANQLVIASLMPSGWRPGCLPREENFREIRKTMESPPTGNLARILAGVQIEHGGNMTKKKPLTCLRCHVVIEEGTPIAVVIDTMAPSDQWSLGPYNRGDVRFAMHERCPVGDMQRRLA